MPAVLLLATLSGSCGGGRVVPLRPSEPTPPDIRALWSGEDGCDGPAHSCAVRAGGSLWRWGSNSAGQVDGSDHARPVPVRVPGLAHVEAVTLGSQQTGALDAEGAVHCWGFGATRVSSRVGGLPGRPTGAR